jgi:phosphoglycerol transferase MdoB-like AlkP superfamily enzyme
MPCLLALLVLAFPRVAIVLLWLFTNFFTGIYNGIIIPVLGFLFLPLTLIVYTYLQRTHAATGTAELVFIFIAVILDLGLVGGGAYGRR